jgi:hypothetical protein
MIFSLKIVACSLKSVKRLPGFQNDSALKNIQGSLNSLVVKTPGILHSPVVNTLVSLYSPVMNTLGSRLLGVFRACIRTDLQQLSGNKKTRE